MEAADAVVVLAKEPVPGRVKTRLQSRFSPVEAARLAEAALRDTLTAVRRSRAPHRVLAWQGSPDPSAGDFAVAPQPDGDLTVRLDAAFASTFQLMSRDVTAPDAVDRTLLIGMDTPQVAAGQLDADWNGADAVLGLSDDGGFWAIGLRRDRPPGVFAGVPMSTSRTGAAQLARLLNMGLTVTLLPPLLDVDTPDAAERVAALHPRLRFSRAHAAIVARAERDRYDCSAVFDRAFAGGSDTVADPPAALPMELARWSGPADGVDRLVVSRCQGPVIDLGCGPGRMVRALTEQGLAALGVDASGVAVAISRLTGGPALHREIGAELPAEGRWGTALLMDGNIGIGGDVLALLRRCRSLVAAGGLILCEVDADPDRHERFDVTLRSGGIASRPMPWVRIGGRALRDTAATVDLLVEEEWTSDQRSFVALRVVG